MVSLGVHTFPYDFGRVCILIFLGVPPRISICFLIVSFTIPYGFSRFSHISLWFWQSLPPHFPRGPPTDFHVLSCNFLHDSLGFRYGVHAFPYDLGRVCLLIFLGVPPRIFICCLIVSFTVPYDFSMFSHIPLWFWQSLPPHFPRGPPTDFHVFSYSFLHDSLWFLYGFSMCSHISLWFWQSLPPHFPRGTPTDFHVFSYSFLHDSLWFRYVFAHYLMVLAESASSLS